MNLPKWINVLNIGYLIGLIIAIDRGWLWQYLLITTIIALILYWKPMFEVMKVIAAWHEDWCRIQGKKLANRIKKR